MNVSVLGLGHVGLVTAACFAEIGHDVVGVDASEERIADLRSGRMPFHEPGLEPLVRAGIAAGRLRFTRGVADAVAHAEVLFVCVGTPQAADGSPDLRQLEELTTAVAAAHVDGRRILVEKSTVPVTTGERVARTLERAGAPTGVEVVSNPEFLREGTAIDDTMRPARIVIGTSSPDAADRVLDVYRPILERSGCHVIRTDVRTAELIKHASNAFLATKISFINAVAEVCERAGADVEAVAEGVGLDPRIGRDFFRAGIGYGGACLPKDVAGFVAMARSLGCDLALLGEVQRLNDRALDRVIEKLRAELWHLSGKTIAVLGLAFKAGTDDLRESPAIRLIERLRAEGGRVVAFDPAAMPAAKDAVPDLPLAPSPIEAARDADAVVIATEWPEFRSLDLAGLRQAMRFPLVVDGRNLFAPDEMREAGFHYASVGRPAVAP